jgi:hypothetical protein
VTTPYVRSSSLTRRHDRHLTEVSMSSPTRESIRQTIAERLLDSLEDLVRRHRALALQGSPGEEKVDLHAELIAAEVAHELATARSALHRHPPLRPT